MPASVAALLKDLSPRFLEGLAESDVESILAAATEQRFLAGSEIMTQGSPAEHFFLLLHGRARYFYMTPDGRKIGFFLDFARQDLRPGGPHVQTC